MTSDPAAYFSPVRLSFCSCSYVSTVRTTGIVWTTSQVVYDVQLRNAKEKPMKRSYPGRMFAIAASALLAGALASVGCNKTYPDQKSAVSDSLRA